MTERDKIFNYTKNRFTSEGFYKISMDEIATELRISKKTIYKYFPSKDILIHEIIKDEIKSMHVIIDEIINKDADVITKFVEIMEYYTARLSKTSDKWMREIQLHLPEFWSEIDKFKTKKIDMILTKLIKEGKKEKLIVDFPPEIIINSYILTTKEICNPQFLNDNNFTFKDALQHSFAMLINGILTEKGRIRYKKMIKAKKSSLRNLIM